MRESRVSSTRAGLWLLIATFVSAFLNYLLSISVSWWLPPEQYGIWGVSLTLMLLSTAFLNAGAPWYLARFLSARVQRARWAETVPVFWTALLANTAIGTVVAASVYALHRLPAFRTSPTYPYVLGIVAVTILILAILTVVRNALLGLFRQGAYGWVFIVEMGVRLLAAWGLIALGWGALGAVGGLGAGVLAALLLNLWYLRDYLGEVARTRLRVAPWQTFVLPSTQLFLSNLAIIFLTNFDLLGLKLFAGHQSDLLAGYYQAVAALARVPALAAQAVMSALFPYMVEEQARGGRRRYARDGLWWAFVLLTPLCLVLILWPDAVLSLFFPPAYQISAGALAVSTAGTLALVFVQVLVIFFQAYDLLHNVLPRLGVAVISLVASLALLVPRWGLMGAATGTSIGSAVALLLLVPPYLAVDREPIPVTKAMSYLIALGLFTGVLAVVPHTSLGAMIRDGILAAGIYGGALLALRVVDIHALGVDRLMLRR